MLPDKPIITAIGKITGQTHLPKPFAHEVHLLEIHIAGTTYIKNIWEIEPKITHDMILTFRREIDNEYDTHAIMILSPDGDKIGYVPKAKNEVISNLLDAGKLIYGKVKEKSIVNDWVKIIVNVYLKE